MGERAQEERKQPVTWEEWYKDQRDTLTTTLGQLLALSKRPQNKEWDTVIFGSQRELLDLIDILWRAVRDQDEKIKILEESNQVLEEILNKRNDDITNVLTRIQEWMKIYQPTLDEAKKDYESLGKVMKNDRDR